MTIAFAKSSYGCLNASIRFRLETDRPGGARSANQSKLVLHATTPVLLLNPPLTSQHSLLQLFVGSPFVFVPAKEMRCLLSLTKVANLFLYECRIAPFSRCSFQPVALAARLVISSQIWFALTRANSKSWIVDSAVSGNDRRCSISLASHSTTSR